MKYSLLFRRIVIGIFGGIFVGSTILLFILWFVYTPESDTSLFPTSGFPILFTGFGALFSGIITLLLFISYFTVKKSLKNKNGA